MLRLNVPGAISVMEYPGEEGVRVHFRQLNKADGDELLRCFVDAERDPKVLFARAPKVLGIALVRIEGLDTSEGGDEAWEPELTSSRELRRESFEAIMPYVHMLWQLAQRLVLARPEDLKNFSTLPPLP